MPNYQAESFFRAIIKESITSSATCPITIKLSKLPNVTNGLLTMSPNTEYEEIFEYNNPQAGTMTVDLIKRGIKPSSLLLTTNGVDYNNTTYQFEHTQNDIIRGDVNHIHLNQAIGNTVLATNSNVGISKLSVAAVNPADPIVVGDNDPRLGIRVANGRIDLTSATTVLTTYNIGFRPKFIRLSATRGSSTGPTSVSTTYDGGSTYTIFAQLDEGVSPSQLLFRHDSQNGFAVLIRNAAGTNLVGITTVAFTSTGFTLSAPNWIGGYTTCSITYEAFA